MCHSKEIRYDKGGRQRQYSFAALVLTNEFQVNLGGHAFVRQSCNHLADSVKSIEAAALLLA